MAAQYGVDYKQQQQLINSLTSARFYDHKTEVISVIETHISWVILTGPYAYKIKKSLDLGFLNYSNLSLRHQYCEQELRINRRTAADIYLDCVAISGPAENPRLNGKNNIIEYAVKMHQFSQQALLSHLAEEGQLTTGIIDQLATQLAVFHHTIDCLAPGSPLGEALAIWHPINENFEQITERMNDEITLGELKPLMDWAEQRYQQLKPKLQKRKHGGFIRECHGDLHLGNIAYIDQQVCMFDAIDFNPGLSWIDVISELAFLCMDLDARGLNPFSYRLLNRYLHITGDYSGLELLRFYQLYRAMVRAKVTAISLGQSNNRNHQLDARFHRYLDLAESYTQVGMPYLIISHGLSGSGKSYYCQQLAEDFQCIHLSSDIERKRLFGLSPLANSKQSSHTNIYNQSADNLTYQRLLDLAYELLGHGFSVIVDATFLSQSRRASFQELAQTHKVAFIIMDLQADMDTLKQQIMFRQQRGNSPSEADISIMEQQLINQEPLSVEEMSHAWPLISRDKESWERFKSQLSQRFHPAQVSTSESFPV